MTTAKIKGIDFEFGGGVVLTVPPLNLAAIELLGDRLAQLSDKELRKEDVSTMIDAAFMALKRNYPDMTREHVANDLLGLENMQEVLKAVMDVSGLLRKESQAPGEATAGSL
jgi:hypothetical protein